MRGLGLRQTAARHARDAETRRLKGLRDEERQQEQELILQLQASPLSSRLTTPVPSDDEDLDEDYEVTVVFSTKFISIIFLSFPSTIFEVVLR